MIQKVTAFILRQHTTGPQLLLINHPHAGVQIPAGTVELGEEPETAVLREAAEETGLTDTAINERLGSREATLPEDQAFICSPTPVFSRPDPASFDWARFRSGIQVTVLRQLGGYTQVSYTEPDRFPDPEYITCQITGWVPDDSLTRRRVRHFFLLDHHGETPSTWETTDDNHTFNLFWAPVDQIPELAYPQNEWLQFFLPPFNKRIKN